MELKVKFLKSGKYNASHVTGGPYITGVKGEEKTMDAGPASILVGRGVVQILEFKDPNKKEPTENQKTKDDLLAEGEKLGVKLQKNWTVETLQNKIDEHKKANPENDGDGE